MLAFPQSVTPYMLEELSNCKVVVTGNLDSNAPICSTFKQGNKKKL